MDNVTKLYWTVSGMKESLTYVVGTVLGSGIELPLDIIDRYAHILGAKIDYHQESLPREIFELLNDILKLPQIFELTKPKLDKIKSIQHKFYTKYSLTQSKFTQNEQLAEKTGLAPFNLGHAAMTMTVAEPIISNLVQRHETNEGQNRFFSNMTTMRVLPKAQSRVINQVPLEPSYGPLIKKSKTRRRRKSANHKSKTKSTRRHRSA